MITYLSSGQLMDELNTPTTTKNLYYYLPSIIPAYCLLTVEEYEEVSRLNAEDFFPLFGSARKMLKALIGVESFPSSNFIPIDKALTVVQVAPFCPVWQANPGDIVLFDDAESDTFVFASNTTLLSTLNTEYGGSWRITPNSIQVQLVSIATALEEIKLDA